VTGPETGARRCLRPLPGGSRSRGERAVDAAGAEIAVAKVSRTPGIDSAARRGPAGEAEGAVPGDPRSRRSASGPMTRAPGADGADRPRCTPGGEAGAAAGCAADRARRGAG